VAVEFDNLIVNPLQSSEAGILVQPAVVGGPEGESGLRISTLVGVLEAVCERLTQQGSK